jgi:HK97 family phage major capsid protein
MRLGPDDYPKSEGSMLMTIEQMLAERKRLLDEAKAIDAKAAAENRPLTEDESAQIDLNLEQAEGLKTKIEAARKKEADDAARRARLQSAESWEGQSQRQQTRMPALAGFNGNGNGNGAGQNVRITGGEGASRFEHFGEYLFKVREAAMSPSLIDQRLMPVAAAPGQRTDVDSLGGFLIPDEFSERIIERMYTTGELLSRIKADGFYLPLQRNTIKLPRLDETSRADSSRDGGVLGYWVGETDSITDSKAKFGQMTLTLHKAGALGYITDEMLEDAPASGMFLERLLTRALIFKVEDAIVNGNGSNKPLGLVAANCAVSASAVTNQTASTVWGDNLTAMWARMWAPCRKTAVWLVNQSVEPFLFSATLAGRFGSASTDVDGIPIYFPAGSILNQGQYGMLMGRPVLPVEYTKAVGTLGDIILWDPASYILVDKAGGPKTASSIHVRFATDEETFRVTYRVDGQPTWDSALTPFDAGNTLSPIVLLAARS